MIPDSRLLDFDHSRLADADQLDEAALLEEHGDLYRSHLAVALWISGWRQRLAERSGSTADPRWNDREDYALREIAAHLRQGDFLPGHVFLTELE